MFAKQSGALETLEPAKCARVFISYSRVDQIFAERLRDALIARDFEAYLDKVEILPGEPWQERLAKLIAIADTVVFVMSDDSIASAICDWEVNEAERVGKRVLPVIYRQPAEANVPGRLKRLQYVFLRDENDWHRELEKLITALLTDIGWIREHTRIADIARRWAERSAGSPGGADEACLRGSDLADAEVWISQRPASAPEPTDLQRRFIGESRRAEQARLRRERRRSFIITYGSLATALIMGVLGWVMFGQWQASLAAQSLFLSDLARQQIRQGDAETAVLLALEALPDVTSGNLTQRLRPYVAAAQQKLDVAYAKGTWHDRPKTATDTRLDGATAAVKATGDSIEPEAAVPAQHSVADQVSPNGLRILRELPGSKSVLLDGQSGSQIAAFEGTGKGWRADLSRDGRRILTGSSEDAFKLWNAQDGTEIAALTHDGKAPSNASFGPDSKRILATEGAYMVVWESETGKETSFFDGLKHDISSFGWNSLFSPDGAHILASASISHERETIWLWDASPGGKIVTLKHDEPISGVAFNSSGSRIVTASSDKTAKIWDTNGGIEIATLRGHEGPVLKALISPDDKFVATVSADMTLRLWDSGAGTPVAVLRGHEAPASSARFSGDGRRLVTTAPDQSARLWDAQTGSQLAVVTRLGGFNDATLNADGTQIETEANDGTTAVWEQITQTAARVLNSSESVVSSAEFSEDGTRVVMASSDTTPRLWGDQGDLIADLAGHESYVYTAVFSPDGSVIATPSSDKTTRLWNGMTGASMAILQGHTGHVVSARFSPDGKTLATVATDKTARFWDVQRGSETALLQSDGGRLLDIRFSPDGKRVLLHAEDDTEQLWDLQSKRLIANLPGTSSRSQTFEFSVDGARILTHPGGQPAEIWDGTTGAPLAKFEGHRSPFSASFSPDSSRVLTTEAENLAHLWNSKTGKEIAEIKDAFQPTTFSADSRRIAVGSSESAASILDARDGNLRSVLRGHEQPIVSIAFSPDGRLVLTGSSDGTARLWDAEQGAEIAGLTGHGSEVVAVAFSRDGRRAMTRTNDHDVRIWTIDPVQRLVRQTQQRVTRCLTPEQRALFHVGSTVPRWCYDMAKWPYNDPAKTPAPDRSIVERAFLARDWVSTWLNNFWLALMPKP